MAALAVERITFEPSRMVLLVRVAAGPDACLGEAAAERLLAARPTLRQHRCLNDEGLPFAAYLPRTSLPHVLEHLIIDYQVSDGKTVTDHTFVGTTEWLSPAEGLARVAVNFTDDLIALAAVKAALALLEGMVE